MMPAEALHGDGVDDVHQSVRAHQRVAEQPIDLAAHRLPRGQISSDAVPDTPRFIFAEGADLEHFVAHKNAAPIRGLTATARIKRGPRQRARNAGGVDNARFELTAVGVLEIDLLVHRRILRARSRWGALRRPSTSAT
jgi:hypothetical protein